jgi:hypothetical protein
MSQIYPVQDPSSIEPYGPYMIIGVYTDYTGKQVFMTEVITATSSKSAANTFRNNNSSKSFSSIHVLPPIV